MQKRSLLFLTGTRADFGKLEPLAIAARDAGHDVTFFVTGMHMLERYGVTRIEVERVEGVRRQEYINQRIGDAQDIILSKTIIGLSDWLHENPADLTIIHGDRIEALAGALVCATNYLRCAHIEGDEVSGTIDEVYRHCNTKLCTYHFVSSQDGTRPGHQPWRRPGHGLHHRVSGTGHSSSGRQRPPRSRQVPLRDPL